MNNSKKADELFGAAIVHDVGRIVLALGIPDRYAGVVHTSIATSRAVHLVEADKLEVTHTEVGAYLLGIWGLPLDVVETAAFHHTPRIFPTARSRPWQPSTPLMRSSKR